MNPLISIITVVKNDEIGIIKTLRSILSQKFNSYELIIIDGLSSDDTLISIKAAEKEFKSNNIPVKLISEKDKGIYDAMNKGIDLANGKFVNFLNSGDSYYDENILSIISSIKNENIDVIYGDSIFNLGEQHFLSRAKDLKNIIKGMIFCHQASFVKRELLAFNKFSTDLLIVSDYNMFLKFFFENKNFYQLNKIICYHEMSGISNKNLLIGYRELKRVKISFNLYRNTFYIDFYSTVFKLKYLIKNIIGKEIVFFLMKIKQFFIK